MGKFYNINRADGYVWLVAVSNGRYYWLHRQGKIGGCQRWTGERAKN